MKLGDLTESSEKTFPNGGKPSITYRQNGDKSWNVVIEYPDGRRVVHTNKIKSQLEKLVKSRYS